MKKVLYFLILIWVIMIFIPMLCILGNGLNKNSTELKQNTTKLGTPTNRDENVDIKVYFPQTKEIKQMKLNEYLIGVVTAEMPASYHVEALKAQAVVARSYVYNKYIKTRNQSITTGEHQGADICTSSEHCQGFLTLNEANEKWGSSWGEKYLKNIEKAVKETDGEILEYNKQPIIAVFHGSSYKRTESAKDVWGNDVVYLKSVESKGDIQAIETQSAFSHEEFKKLIKENFPDISFQADVSNWIKNFKYSEGGSVLSVDIGNKTVKGSLIRTIFSLKSSNFEIVTDKKNITFNVKGSGHGVGMSQFGANDMANENSSYKEILSWYYLGTDINFWGSTT